MQRIMSATGSMIHWSDDGKRAICNKGIRAWRSDYRLDLVNCPRCLARQEDTGKGLDYAKIEGIRNKLLELTLIHGL